MVTKSEDSDISHIESAARTIGRNPKRGAIVIQGSTVYPGVTEDVLKLILGEESGLICGNFLRKNLVKPSDIPLCSSRIIALVNELTPIFHRMGLSDMARFMAMEETPVLVDVRGMFDQEGAGMGVLLQEIASSRHAF